MESNWGEKCFSVCGGTVGKKKRSQNMNKKDKQQNTAENSRFVYGCSRHLCEKKEKKLKKEKEKVKHVPCDVVVSRDVV